LEDFGQMQGSSIRVLGDLLAAAEAVGDDEPVCWSLADGGEELEFADGLGDFVVLAAMEAEGSGHAATSGSWGGEINTETTEERFFGGHLHERLVMAVAVDQGFAIQLRQSCVRGDFLLEEFAEQERLTAQGLSAVVVWKEIDEFVAEDGDAAGFETYDGDSGFDLGLERVEDFEEQTLGAVEHAEVVEGASAAEVGARDENAEASGFEDFDGGAGGGGEEIVVEGVGPEENGGS
jgi:hypothetical protein